MKPSHGIETITGAWNRWVNTYKRQPSGKYCDSEIPIRLRGYSELTMGELTDKERKAIDASIRRGYTLAKSSRWYMCLQLILRSVDFQLGYLGKTRGSIWMPDTESRDALLQHMEAQLVMTEKFSAGDLSTYGEHYVRVNVNTRANPMKAHLTELRQVIDEHMEFWVRRRTRLANKLESDDAVIRIPFDSMKEKYYRD